jgi:integrase
MSRRSGQNGYIERKGNTYYVRFWMDVPGQEKRKHMNVRICPANGPGKMTKPARERRAKQIIAESGADTEEQFMNAVNSGVTFREQASTWLQNATTRSRKPIRETSVPSIESCLNKWLLPDLGALPIADVNNLAVKKLVAKMVASGDLGPKSINTYVQIVKSVVASAVNDEGEEIYPRKWNHDFIDLPVITNQRKPAFTSEVMTGLVNGSTGAMRVLYALCGATGMRIAEVLGLDIERHLTHDFSTIFVRQQAKGTVLVSYLKSDNAYRDIDLCREAADMLKVFVGNRTSGLLFCSRNGKPLSQSNIRNRSLHPLLKTLCQPMAGAHAFRRYRTTWLRKNRAPEDLITYWTGHAEKTVTDGYSKLKQDVAFRKACAEEVGLGFKIPGLSCDVVRNVPKQEVSVLEESIA